MSIELEAYSVVAYNTAKDSENKIHDDAVAKRFGFTGDNLKVKAKWTATFTEHGIQVPQLLFLKVANEIQMATDLVFVRTQ